MKVLLVCAGGLSTSLLMKKMKGFWEEQGTELNVEACSLAEYKNRCRDFDIILVGPQISYHLDDIREASGLPCDAIDSTDYALGRCSNIYSQTEKLYKKD
ncbi:MAG: PTS sugar transporter subunit IIB [Erysipelotrichaceae bacterium]|nr:PTS sugar transporter subunit IIB [Erysipelotrichaceae bacterium]